MIGASIGLRNATQVKHHELPKWRGNQEEILDSRLILRSMVILGDFLLQLHK